MDIFFLGGGCRAGPCGPRPWPRRPPAMAYRTTWPPSVCLILEAPSCYTVRVCPELWLCLWLSCVVIVLSVQLVFVWSTRYSRCSCLSQPCLVFSCPALLKLNTVNLSLSSSLCSSPLCAPWQLKAVFSTLNFLFGGKYFSFELFLLDVIHKNVFVFWYKLMYLLDWLVFNNIFDLSLLNY